MRTKKSLGQHFLNSPEIIKNIVSASEISPTDLILEIGPGEGVLTKALLETGAKVVTVEKDDRLIPELHKKFSKEISLRKLELIHADILDVELPYIIKTPYKIVANIPYYITGQVIRMFLESDNQPTSMTLLLQKEVAERIVVKDGKESLLSMSVKVFGDPKYIRTVPRGAFSPHPKVDSAVIKIENISKERLGGLDEKFFFRVLHLGFAHKRKQLLPNLSSIYKKEVVSKILKDCGIDEKIRAEDLSLEDWLRICKKI